LEPKANDIDFVNWLGQNHIPFQLLFTKEDKQSRNKTDSTVAKFRKALKSTWEIMPGCIITSATINTGRKELLDFISKVIKEMSN
jgi:GTP-binding protein